MTHLFTLLATVMLIYVSHCWLLWNSVNPVLDPTWKCMYLDVAWDEEWVLAAKDRMRDIVSI